MEQRTISPAVILLAEDNEADQELVRRSLTDSKIYCDLKIVEDGVQAMDYLLQRGEYAHPGASPRPDILLLDIAMPRMDGKQVLKAVKSDASLRAIPVVILTTSSREVDVIESYHLGVNAYITKPADAAQFMNVVKQLRDFWLMVVVLPPKA